MAGKKNELGQTGRIVAENVKRFREVQNLTYAELARRLEAVGRTIPVLGLSRIEDGARRVDPDDLTALAAALGVGPIALLMPRGATPDKPAEVTGMRGTAEELYGWMKGETLPGTPSPREHTKFQFLSLPSWQLAPDYRRNDGLVKGGMTHLARGLAEDDPTKTRYMLEFIQNELLGGEEKEPGSGND